ncbi:MAG: EAL domain-containing protein [Methylophagaceae bacterium]
MHNFLSHLTLRQQLLLSKLLPALILVLLIGSGIISNWHIYQSQSHSNRLYQVASVLSETIQALQYERELSTIHLIQHDEALLENLKQHRKNVDKLISKLILLDRNPLLRGLFPNAHQRIYFDDELAEQIQDTRIKIEINENPQYLTQYTEIIQQILRLFESKAMLTDDPDLTFFVLGLTKVLWIQELAGQESALISKVFNNGQLDNETYFTLRELFNSQESLAAYFLSLSGLDHQRSLFLGAQDDVSSKIINRIRKKIFSQQGNSGDQINIGFANLSESNDLNQSINYWMESSHQRGVLLTKVSNNIIKYIVDYTKEKKDEAFFSVLLYAGFGLLALLVSSIISMAVSRRFISGIDAAISSIHSYKHDGLFKEIDIALGHDEVSELADTFNQLIRGQSDAEKRLYLSNKVVESAHEGVIVFDENKIILMSNATMMVLCGHDTPLCEGSDLVSLASKKNQVGIIDKAWKTVDVKGNWQGEFWVKDNKTGNDIPTLTSISAVKDDDGDIINYIAIVANISTLKQAQEEVEYQATHDTLTSLPNREYFIAFLEHEIKRHERNKNKFAVLFMDLNNFKYVNDNLGHGIGDEVLKIAADRLKGCLREEDLVVRHGGDEFIVFLPNTSSENSIRVVAEHIIKVISEPMMIDAREIRIGVSIGISQYPDNARDIKQLISNADMAMYQAKKETSLFYSFYTSAVNDKVKYRFEIEGELWKALDNKELFVCYQPKIDMGTGDTIGAEALVRWQHPERGLIPPDQFIPIAEAAGLIDQIGEFVAEESMQLARQLKTSTPNLIPIAINVSPIQFRTSGIVDKLRSTLKKYKLKGDAIQIEITETVLVKGNKGTNQALNEISDMGIKIAIDDFGTGYSSLSYLQEFPIDIVKIDSSFIWKLFDHQDSKVLVETIINMAKGLNKSLVAEGVEEERHVKWLQEHGCDIAQGYYYSKPLIKEDFLNFLEIGEKVIPLSSRQLPNN